MNHQMRVLVISLVLAGVVAAPVAPADPKPHGLRVHFPHIELLPDEQIESFRLFVPCGHIHSIVGIPDDWNVEVVRAISATEELRASAGHGISYIKQMSVFDGVVRITVDEAKCFKPRAEITAVFDNERVIKLSSESLRLLP